jgi:hypothetical protein
MLSSVTLQLFTSGDTTPIFLEEVILNVPHLVYVGASYSGRKGMGIEINATYNSSQRLPDVGYENRSPAFTMLNGQFSKEGRAFGQIYVGIQKCIKRSPIKPCSRRRLAV